MMDTQIQRQIINNLQGLYSYELKEVLNFVVFLHYRQKLTQPPENQSVKKEQKEYAYGSISGMLWVIDDNQYVIYPTLGASEVHCQIEEIKLRKIMTSAVGKYVTVTGKLTYLAHHHPSQIEVHEIEIHPDKNELPTLSSFAGIAPDATGNLSTNEFIQNLRNDWR